MSNELLGRSVLITRSGKQSGRFRQLLETAGATVFEIPTIAIQARPDSEIDEAVQTIASSDWIIFTSANSSDIFLGRARTLGLLPAAGRPRICAIGPATAASVRQYGLEVDLIPDESRAEGVLEDFTRRHQGRLSGLKVLIPRAGKAREILPDQLREQGADVRVRPVYDTVIAEDSRERLKRILEEEPPDIVTLTSSSTVHNFVELVQDPHRLESLRFAAIGPITAATAADYQLNVVVQPEQSTVPELARAILSYFGARV